MSSRAHLFITDTDAGMIDINFRYLLGFQPSLGVILYDTQRVVIFLDARYFPHTAAISVSHIRTIFKKPDLRVEYVYMQDMISQVTQELYSYDTVDFSDTISLYYKTIFENHLSSDSHTTQSHIFFAHYRVIKTPQEQEKIREAITIIDRVF